MRKKPQANRQAPAYATKNGRSSVPTTHFVTKHFLADLGLQTRRHIVTNGGMVQKAHGLGQVLVSIP